MKINAFIRLNAPLHHSEFGRSESNAVSTRRFPVLLPDGKLEEAPAVSGNALRGRMRRLVFRQLLDDCGLLPGTVGYDRIYAAVANGGTLTGSDTMVDPGALRKVRADCPPLSVFGSALYSHMLAGRMSVGICWPVCDVTVTAGLVPDCDAVNMSLLEAETAFVRMPERERQRPEDTKVGPMPYQVEVLAAGTTLVSEIRFMPESTEVERSCVAWALDRIDSLGGKSGIGLGRVEITHNGDAGPYAQWLAGDLGAAKAVLEAI